MAGFYKQPFSSVVPGAAANNEPKDSFMNVARSIRERIYCYLKKEQESCEVPKLKEDRKLDQMIDDYLKRNKNLSARNDLRKEKWVSRFSVRCWEVLLKAEEKFPINYYFFDWLRSNTDEEVVFKNLSDLVSGEVKLKDLKKGTQDTVGSTDALSKEREMWETQKKEFVMQIQDLKRQLKTERNEHKLKESQIEELKKEVTDEKATTALLRADLKKTLEENQFLIAKIEETTEKAEEKNVSAREEIKRLQKELDRVKQCYVERELNEEQESTNLQDINENTEKKVACPSNKKAIVKKKEVGMTATVSRRAEAREGVHLLMEQVIYVDHNNKEKEQEEATHKINEKKRKRKPSEVEAVETTEGPDEDTSPVVEDSVSQPEEPETVDWDSPTLPGASVGPSKDVDQISTDGDDDVAGEGTGEDEPPVQEAARKKIRQNSEDDEKGREHQKEERTKLDEEWVAVCYSRDIRYIGRVTGEEDNFITAKFLERRPDGVYELTKKDPEKTEKKLVFARQVNVKNFAGTCRYEIKDETLLRKKQEQHWRFLRSQEKVERCWKDNDLDRMVWASYDLKVGDLKTIQTKMSKEDEQKMKVFSEKFRVGWLNDKVINASMKLLEASSTKEKGEKVLAGDSLLLEKFSLAKKEELLKLDWMKKVKFMEKDVVLFPVNHGGHWTLGVVRPKEKKICHFDSYIKLNSGCKEFFFTSMRKLIKGAASWKEETPSTPQQIDGKSCGVYVLKVAESILIKTIPSFSKEELIKYRVEIAANLLNGHKITLKLHTETS